MYVPETVEEGRARLRADAHSPEALASTVATRLEEAVPQAIAKWRETFGV